MENIEQPKTVHEILQEADSYSTKLALACRTNASNVIQVVKLERFTSKYWPAIEELAMATDSKAYKARIAFLKKNITTRQKATA